MVESIGIFVLDRVYWLIAKLAIAWRWLAVVCRKYYMRLRYGKKHCRLCGKVRHTFRYVNEPTHCQCEGSRCRKCGQLKVGFVSDCICTGQKYPY